jgi:hypothetical protein
LSLWAVGLPSLANAPHPPHIFGIIKSPNGPFDVQGPEQLAQGANVPTLLSGLIGSAPMRWQV